MSNDDTPKQVIVIRKDLKMKGGKLGVQISHASNAFMSEKWLKGQPPSALEAEWCHRLSTKVALEVHSEEELIEIFQRAKAAGLNAHLITDAGLTVFKEPTKTCVGIGPNRASQVGKITGHLKLYGGGA